MNPLYREEALGMIDYVEGEGYKRLAFNLRRELAVDRRAEYARLALHSFAQAWDTIEQQALSQQILVRLSEAQCLIWLDPQEAIRRAELLREEAILLYPAMLDKINRTINFARQRLKACRSNLPLLFNLDVRPGELLREH